MRKETSTERTYSVNCFSPFPQARLKLIAVSRNTGLTFLDTRLKRIFEAYCVAYVPRQPAQAARLSVPNARGIWSATIRLRASNKTRH